MENTDIQLDKDNLEQQLAFEIIEKTNTSLFITGKAGTYYVAFNTNLTFFPVLSLG